MYTWINMKDEEVCLLQRLAECLNHIMCTKNVSLLFEVPLCLPPPQVNHLHLDNFPLHFIFNYN